MDDCVVLATSSPSRVFFGLAAELASLARGGEMYGLAAELACSFVACLAE